MSKRRQRFDRSFKPYRPEQALLEPYVIEIDPAQNPRSMSSEATRDNIQTLKNSIRERGVEESIKVRYDAKTGVPILVHGECRVMACRALWDEGHEVLMPATKVSGDEAERIIINLTANSGLLLQPWEIGRASKLLMQKYGMVTEDIAKQIGKPVRFVTEAIALADAPHEAKQMIAAGEVSPARVLQEINELGDNAVEALHKAVAEHTATNDGHRPGPLARRKAPGTGQRALKLADELAHAVIAGKTSPQALVALARDYLSQRQG